MVLKSTGSAFEDFVRDEYTTLPEAKDSIFSTCVECNGEFTLPKIQNSASLMPTLSQVPFNAIFDSVREVTCKTFAEDESASVQATLYKMAAQPVQNWTWIQSCLCLAQPSLPPHRSLVLPWYSQLERARRRLPACC